MAALLAGLKVLDFTSLLPGPVATLMLADLGAEVLKVESPTRMDLARMMPPYVDAAGRVSCLHAYLGRNKRCLVLDLKREQGRLLIERLMREQGFDVVVEQFRPGVMERLGLSYERLSGIAPGLIYCSLTGYGQSGPYRERAGHDINYLALAGVMSYSGTREGGPVAMGIQVADMASGSNNAVIGILAALIHRLQTGEGQHIDVSMTDGMLPYHAVGAIKTLAGEDEPGFETEVLNGGSLYGFYRTADGKYLAFGGLEPQFFAAFCETLGLEDLIEGSVMQPDRLDRARERVAEVIAGRTRDEWMELFAQVDACVEPVLSFNDAVSSELVKAREMLVDVPGPNGGTLPQIAQPIKFSGFRPQYRHTGTELGCHTREILISLGYGEQEIDSLKAQGIFGEIDI